jgi:hypothetical protein
METPANDRGRFLYLYFQCIEVDGVKWHISEECFCRGFKLKPTADRAVMKFVADEKATYEDLFVSSMSALAIWHSLRTPEARQFEIRLLSRRLLGLIGVETGELSLSKALLPPYKTAS